MEDKLVFDPVRNQTSCTQAAARAVAVVRHKRFGKTADRMDHSTMGYRWSACIASSYSSLDMFLESGPLQKQNEVRYDFSV